MLLRNIIRFQGEAGRWAGERKGEREEEDGVRNEDRRRMRERGR